MSTKVMLMLVVVLGLVGMVQAADPIVTYFWGNTSGDWSNPLTWGGGTTLPDASRFPTYQDIAITIGNTTIDVTTTGNTAVDMQGGYSTGNSILNIAAGAGVSILHNAQVGCGNDADADVASLVINDRGSFVSEMLHVGDSKMDAGTINVYDGGYLQTGFWGLTVGFANATATGTINVKGGLFVLYGTAAINPMGLINIEAGQFQVYGSRLAEMQGFINAGRIVGYNGAGTVNAVVSGDGKWTVLTAVPEPATMILLGLGGLLLRKKIA